MSQTISCGVRDHAVKFYDRESDLVGLVAGHLATALRGGHTIVVIATPDHRRAIREELTSLGTELSAVAADGRIVELDAASTLSRITRVGWIAPNLFREVIGDVVAEAIGRGRPVSAYGEMVALLWEAGDVPSVVDLESLWNDLQGEMDFSLLCAYPSTIGGGEDPLDASERVCSLHTAVIAPAAGDERLAGDNVNKREVTARFQATIEAPAAARHLLVDTLRGWGHDRDLVDDAAIVVTELAGNAVVHVGRPFMVTVCDTGELVRIFVRDLNGVAPLMGERHGDMASSGRGLGLVDAVTASWGVDLAHDHKVVWADLTVR